MLTLSSFNWSGDSHGVLWALLLLLISAWACRAPGDDPPPLPSSSSQPTTSSRVAGPPRSSEYLHERQRMVAELAAHGIKDPRVLAAMESVPRHWFVPRSLAAQAYDDVPLSIGWDQTISQPYVVATMTELLNLKPREKILEIGTGSGYQAAVLSELTDKVFTIEIVEPLAMRTIRILRERGYDAIRVCIGDGYKGWPEEAPFAAMIVTCAPESVPPELVRQLAVGGRMVIPVGPAWGEQELILLRKQPSGELKKEIVTMVRFVPMVRDQGKAHRP